MLTHDLSLYNLRAPCSLANLLVKVERNGSLGHLESFLYAYLAFNNKAYLHIFLGGGVSRQSFSVLI